jgi:transcriptional regulator with XRE-family HTH domain
MNEQTFKQWFGQRIRRAREQRGLTRNALARMLPATIDPGVLGNWERGEVYPRAANIAAIIDALDTTPHDLFCGS